MVYDPDAGDTFADCLDLTSNPAVDEAWETHEIEYVDDEGEPQRLEIPLTVADWAATEGRFKKQFAPLPEDQWTEDAVPFHEYLAASEEERDGKTPFIWVLLDDKRLGRMAVSGEIVRLAEDRLLFWGQLKELAAFQPAPAARDVIADELEAEFETRVAALEAEHQAKMAELRANLPAVMARRLAEGLLRTGNGTLTVQEILAKAQATPGLEPISLDGVGLAAPSGGVAVAPVAVPVTAEPLPAAPGDGVAAEASEAAVAVAEEEEEDEGLVLEPFIETALCTTCDECININKRLFAYDGNKQAYIKDAKAGTFREIVMAAEKCTARIIHPGTPLNPKEKDLDKWIKRGEQFN
jgi:pyruvate-ferredoxin/flavodoxin oxidoreductase